jgi:hypothetical protein
MVSNILNVFEYFILFIVGILWGSTNYLIELFYYDLDYLNEKNITKKMIMYLKKNLIPLVLFLINQIGSLLFYFCLGKISKYLIIKIYR